MLFLHLGPGFPVRLQLLDTSLGEDMGIDVEINGRIQLVVCDLCNVLRNVIVLYYINQKLLLLFPDPVFHSYL
jgi:hypothetical protein